MFREISPRTKEHSAGRPGRDAGTAGLIWSGTPILRELQKFCINWKNPDTIGVSNGAAPF